MSKVLIVDDEVEITDFLYNFLQRFKISAEKANSGKDALKIYKSFKPDWVLLDIKMPDMDGFEVLEKIRAEEHKAKIMMITGRDNQEAQDKAKSLGVIDYIIKPLDLEELHGKIEKYILAK